MRICTEQKIEYFIFASQVLGVRYRHEDGARVIANLANDGRILAVAVFNNFTDTNCELSIASDGSRRWNSKSFIRAVFEYAFLQCRLLRVTGVIEADNETALKNSERHGFRREGVLRDWFIAEDGTVKDGILFGLLRKECKWLTQ